jgi:hypothetical protein
VPSVPGRPVLGQRSLGAPTILVTNQYTLSDGENFTEGYRTMKLGKVVGEPTAGWDVYTGGGVMIDGTTVRLPFMRNAQLDGTALEQRPRAVDIPVERAMGEGIIPDIISSDLHGKMKQPGFGIVGDLPTTLTKFIPMGLSFEKIIAACTVDAAKVVGWQDRIGSLEVSREADIAVLQIVDDPVTLHDSVGGKKLHKQRIAAKWTVRAGELFQGRG